MLMLTNDVVATEPAETPKTNAAAGFVPAVLIDKSEPVYPRPALHENREGWVRVSFDINRNGRVVNAIATESVGGSIFETAAVRSAGRWRYAPAEQDGRPVAQLGNDAVVTFVLNERARGSSKRFADRYNDILELIAKKQFYRANVLAQSVFDEWPLNLYELSKLWSLRAELALVQNDLPAAESALRKATANEGRWLDSDAYRSLLLAMVHVDLEIGQFKKAIESFQKLTVLDPYRGDEFSQTARMIHSLKDIIDSDQILATDGTIQRSERCESCRSVWSFGPVRKSFTISNVVGDIQSVVLTCTTVRVPADFSNDKTYFLPLNNRDCEVDILGDDGTTLRVYQLPDG